MAIQVTAGDLARDRTRIIKAIGNWLRPQSDDRRYDWLYLNSPGGVARVWLAEDDRGALVGLGSAFPRKISRAGSLIDGCVFGDFGVAPEHRSAGLALQLQRACFESLADGWSKVAYDFPSAGMMAIYKRLGRGSALPFVRTAKPLRADKKIEAKIPVKSIAKVASSVANQVLALRDRTSSNSGGYSVAGHHGKCGEEFTVLAKQAGAGSSCCVFRSAEYLNWRYLDHPTLRFEMLTARRNGELAGYLVLTHESNQTRVVDLFAAQDDNAFAGLLAHATEIARSTDAETLSAPVVSGSRQHAALLQQGFKDRESAHLLIFEANNSQSASKIGSQNWFLMDGDRDS